MKLITTIFLLMFATASALASINPLDLTAQRDVTSGTLVIRSIVGLENTSLFEVYDDIGNVLYSDSVVAGDFINKRFPAITLVRNTYHLVITDVRGRTTQPLRMDTNGNLLDHTTAEVFLFPRVDLRAERMLVIDYTNKGGRRVNISIANTNGDIVFSDVVNGKEEVQRAYRLDQLAVGNYQLIVSARDVKSHATAFALR
ncbi:hypothetical protein [Neolewinella persica]|uniref:hypothetical protein n=1 Tax=Neolewinella persica TaxID=70998 RepID=UPI0003813828|nr:hypothetical protein [Neolewinella persica]